MIYILGFIISILLYIIGFYFVFKYIRFWIEIYNYSDEKDGD